MSQAIETIINELENEVVSMKLIMGDGCDELAEQIVAMRHGARHEVDITLMATSPSQCVGHPELAIAG